MNTMVLYNVYTYALVRATGRMPSYIDASPTSKRRKEKKNIRNEMRQATLIENLYKCLFVGDVVEIYKKKIGFLRVCVCVCALCVLCVVLPNTGTWCIRNIYCIQIYYLWPSFCLICIWFWCHGKRCDKDSLFSGNKFRDANAIEIEKETNVTDEKSNGFHQSFY